jgi:hypothetical protein
MMRRLATGTSLLVWGIISVLGGLTSPGMHLSAQGKQRYFSETGHTIKNRFLDYWEGHEGLQQQGYPLTEEIQEQSDIDGKVYTMQYFERAVFELHPENAAPNDVLLSLLGVSSYQRYGPAGASGQTASKDNPRFFSETNHTLGGKFRAYWESHGGLAQQGYPISDEFPERSALNGKTYRVQYFQRAVFELHPEYANTQYEVLLSHLGREQYERKHGSGLPAATATSTATSAATQPPGVPATPSPASAADTATELSGVSMVSPTEGWAVGRVGAAGQSTDQYRGLVLHYKDGKWTPESNPTGPGQYLTAIDMVSTTEGWAVGNDTILHYSNGAWQSDLAPGMHVDALSSISMVSSTEGWAVGGGLGPAIMLHYEGGQWHNVSVPSSKALWKVQMLSASDGWAVGGDILHYTGGRWVAVSKPEGVEVGSLGMASATEGWAGGPSALLHYTSGQWSVAKNSEAKTLGTISMLSASEGWATYAGADTGNVTRILHYNGQTWSFYPGPNIDTLRINDLNFISATEGWAVGLVLEQGSGTSSKVLHSAILHYQNGTWTLYRNE